MENREIKAGFYRALGKVVGPSTLVASNSSSMGPGVLAPFFAEGGGGPASFLNLHFFSPAEHPMMQLVEVIRGADTTDDAVATAHAFVRKINKTPVLLRDGSPGFLVNAGLAAYMLEAEKLYREGTPVEAIDAAMRESIFPMGPFELGDQAGLDIAAGMFDTIAAAAPIDPPRSSGSSARRSASASSRAPASTTTPTEEDRRVVRPRRAGAEPRAQPPARTRSSSGARRRSTGRRASSATGRSSARKSATWRSCSASASRCISAGRSSTRSSAGGSRSGGPPSDGGVAGGRRLLSRGGPGGRRPAWRAPRRGRIPVPARAARRHPARRLAASRSRADRRDGGTGRSASRTAAVAESGPTCAAE
jgi:hypothetical protein